jgi:hypothetical protein
MNDEIKKMIWGQFGAAIDALVNAIKACPAEHWGDEKPAMHFWYIAYHTIFWLDYYLSDSSDNFQPPEPYTMSETDPDGKMPPRVYSPDELLSYLDHGRQKARRVIFDLSDDSFQRVIKFRKANLPFPELILYTMRHIQHHSAQLNLLLRQRINSAPGWTFRATD